MVHDKYKYINNLANSGDPIFLSCCPKAVRERRYYWRHDLVLKALADSICTAMQSSKSQAVLKQTVPFIRAGQKENYLLNSAGRLLVTAHDWQFQCDLGRQLKFSDRIATTSLCPGWALIIPS